MTARARLLISIFAGMMAIALPRPTWATWSQTNFQVGGYNYQEALTDAARFKLMNSAGIDWVSWTSTNTTLHNAARTDKVLDSLRVSVGSSFKLRDMVTYGLGDAGQLMYNITNPINLSAIRSTLDTTKADSVRVNRPVTAGWAVWDEPCDAAYFANIGAESWLMDTCSVCNDRLAYTNLFPSYVYDVTSTCTAGSGCSAPAKCYYQNYGVGSGMSKADGYAAYLRAYLSQFDSKTRPAQLLSFDSYPFQDPTAPLNDYFMNLRIARDVTEEYSRTNQRIPFWVVVQLSPFRVPGQSAYRTPFGFTNTRWQVYTALAYGAKGVSYWGLTSFLNSGEDWGPGIIKDNGDTVSVVYSQIRQLNSDLHNLGPTLMKLDPVETIHRKLLSATGIEDESIDSTRLVYNIISSFSGTGSDSAMAGYLKDRSNGDDYLLVVNKALTNTYTFTINLTNAADSVMLISRTNGNASLVTSNASSFTTASLPPGQGELYKILDQTYEYIPNVKVMAVSGDRQYFGNDKGAYMVNRGTSRRVKKFDGTVNTPVADLSVTNSRVYICQDNGWSHGNVVYCPLDLTSASLFCLTTSRPLAVSAQVTDTGSVVVIDRDTLLTKSDVKVYSTGGTLLKTLSYNDNTGPTGSFHTPNVAYDVAYMDSLGSFVVAHGHGYTRHLAYGACTALDSSYYRTPTPTNVRLSLLGTGLSQIVFAGRNEGTIGGVEKMNSHLVRYSPNGWWPAAQTEPSVKDVHASGNHVMFGSTSPGGDFFLRLRAIDLWTLGSRSTTAPTAVALTPDSIALMANGTGVARSSLASLSGRYMMVPSPREAAEAIARDSLQSALPRVLAFSIGPNPAHGVAMFQLEMPRSDEIELTAFDVQGRRVALVNRSKLDPGRYDLSWVVPRTGVYFMRLRVGKDEIRRKLVAR